MKERFLILLIVISSISSCMFFDEDCDSYVPQKWHIGEIEAELVTQKPVLKVGDTILFKFKLNRNLRDIFNQDMDIDIGVQVFNKITTTANLSDTTNSDVFSIDTTIFKVFNNYFDMVLVKGDTINVYTHKCELIENYWEIETQYIAKKPGNYRATIKFWKIYTSESNLDDGVCMEGDKETFGAKLV